MSSVYLVLHEKLPTYSMTSRMELGALGPKCYHRRHFSVDYSVHRNMHGEPIETVNSKIVGMYKTEEEANGSARNYFFRTLGLKDNGESENGGYLSSLDDTATRDWDDEVWVVSHEIEKYEL